MLYNKRYTSIMTNPIETEGAGVRYRCAGRASGSCGGGHRTLMAALDCLHTSLQGEASGGGFSDRQIWRDDGAELTRTEVMSLANLQGCAA